MPPPWPEPPARTSAIDRELADVTAEIIAVQSKDCPRLQAKAWLLDGLVQLLRTAYEFDDSIGADEFHRAIVPRLEAIEDRALKLGR